MNNIKNSLRVPEYLTLIQIAKKWQKERHKPYKDILEELFNAFWQGHFDQEAYVLVAGAKTPKNNKEADKNGTKVTRKSMLLGGFLPTMANHMPDEVKDNNTSLEEKYKAMATLTPDEYKDSLIEMERIVVSKGIFKYWVKNFTNLTCDFWSATGRSEITVKIERVLEAGAKILKITPRMKHSRIINTLSSDRSLDYGLESIKQIIEGNYPAAIKRSFTGLNDYIKSKNT